MTTTNLGPARGASRLALAVVAAFVLACCSTAPSEPTSVEATTAAAETVPAQATDCVALDELGCLDSTDCTLHLGDAEDYVCRVAASECEVGFVQRSGRREDCPDGCAYTPANCYCAPDVTCVCGGGPPAMCIAS